MLDQHSDGGDGGTDARKPAEAALGAYGEGAGHFSGLTVHGEYITAVLIFRVKKPYG
jgi:hypothetical protein